MEHCCSSDVGVTLLMPGLARSDLQVVLDYVYRGWMTLRATQMASVIGVMEVCALSIFGYCLCFVFAKRCGKEKPTGTVSILISGGRSGSWRMGLTGVKLKRWGGDLSTGVLETRPD